MKSRRCFDSSEKPSTVSGFARTANAASAIRILGLVESVATLPWIPRMSMSDAPSIAIVRANVPAATALALHSPPTAAG
jgi:hypothetical protein